MVDERTNVKREPKSKIENPPKVSKDPDPNPPPPRVQTPVKPFRRKPTGKPSRCAMLSVPSSLGYSLSRKHGEMPFLALAPLEHGFHPIHRLDAPNAFFTGNIPTPTSRSHLISPHTSVPLRGFNELDDMLSSHQELGGEERGLGGRGYGGEAILPDASDRQA